MTKESRAVLVRDADQRLDLAATAVLLRAILDALEEVIDNQRELNMLTRRRRG